MFTMQPMKRSTHFAADIVIAIGLFILVIIPFAKILSTPDTLIYNSDINYFYPHETIIRHSLEQDSFPLWNPYFGGGSPQLSKIQTGFLYPPSVLLRTFLPIVPMFNWDAIIHIYLAGLGIYLLLRDLAVGRSVSSACAIFFMFSGSIIPRVFIGHVSVLHTIVWIGWLLFAYRRLLHSRSWGNLLLTVLCSGLVVLGGHPQFSLIVLAVPITYFVFVYLPPRLMQKDWQEIRQAGLNSILVALLTGGLLAVQLGPFYEWLLQTNRGSGAAISSLALMTQHSFNIAHLLTMILPLIWFDPLSRASVNLSGASHFWEVSPFVGFSALFLLCTGVWLAANKKKPLTLYFLGLAVVGLVMSMGNLNPLYSFLYTKLPYFRAPGRFLILWTFSLTVLVGLYADEIPQIVKIPAHRSRLQKPAYVALFLFVCGILLMIAWSVTGPDFVSNLSIETDIVSNLQVPDVSQGSSDILTRTFQYSLRLFTTTTGLLAVLLWIGQSNRVKSRWWEGLFLFMVAGEMLFFVLPVVQPYTAVRLFNPDHPLSRLNVDAANVRIPGYREPPNYFVPTLNHVQNGEEYFALDALLAAGARGEYLLSAGYAAVSSPLDDPDFELVQQVDGAYLYQHVHNLPRIYAAPTIEIVDTHEAALEFVLADSFDGDQKAVVTMLTANSSQNLPRPSLAESAATAVFSANYLVYENDRVTAEVETDRPVMVVFSEMVYPGWQATVNGRSAPIWRANYTFRGVIVEKGKHIIEMEFKPQSFRVGLTITLLTAGIIFLITIWAAIRYFYVKRKP